MRNVHLLAASQKPTDGVAAPSVMQAWSGMDVPTDAQDMQPARSTASAAGERPAGLAQVAGAVIVNHRHQTSGPAYPIVPNVRIAPVLAVDFYRGAK